MSETRFLLSERDNRHAQGYGSPGVRWWGYQGRRKPITCIVLHTAETPASRSSARSVAEWQARADRPSSYHVLVDSHNTMRTVNDGDTAFHVANFNSGSLGLSFATKAIDWNVNRRWDEQALVRGAAVCRQWQALYGIPARWLTRPEAMAGARGFVRHSTMDPARRSDPGMKFPARQFFDLLDDEGDDMTPAERKMLEDIHREIFTAGDDKIPDGGGSRTLRDRVFQNNAALGRLDGLTPAAVAAEVAKRLPAGTIDVDLLAGKVADVIFARAGKA